MKQNRKAIYVRQLLQSQQFFAIRQAIEFGHDPNGQCQSVLVLYQFGGWNPRHPRLGIHNQHSN